MMRIPTISKNIAVSFRLTVMTLLIVLSLVLINPVTAAEPVYSEDEVVQAIEEFFGTGAEGIAKVVRKVFKEQGQPQAIIVGEEASAAIGIGARYGKGTLQTKSGVNQALYWQGPSVGIDFGANATKVYALIYNIPDSNQIFKRYPAVEGSLYFVGGVGVSYMELEGTVIAPIRFGAGWRQGVSIGYINFSRKKRLNPF